MNNIFIFYFKFDIVKQKWKWCDINLFCYKVSFLIKSEGDLFVITKCIYNHARLIFFLNLEVLLNLMVFRGTKDVDGCESIRSFYREMLEDTPNQYDTSVRVEFEDHFPNLEVLLNALWNLFDLIWNWTP